MYSPLASAMPIDEAARLQAYDCAVDERAPPRVEAGAPEQCTFLICARAGRCQQPSNCLAGVIPVNPAYQPLYKAARDRED